MKTITCIMLICCFCLAGFTVSKYTVDVYLKNNEAVFISRQGNKTIAWLYTYDQDTLTWKVEEASALTHYTPRINVHFVEPFVF